jgi:protein-S-isoprenylcysteine O-methyltransferase Ste14
MMKESSVRRRRLIVSAPRVLFFVGVAVVIAGLLRQLLGVPEPRHLAGGALLACYLGWLLLEAPVTFRGTVAELKDAATLLAYASARLGILVAVATVPMRWQAWSDWLLAPMALFAAGVALRLTAIWTLGHWYSHHVARGAGQVTLTSGPYRFVRHPAYTGMLLAHAGLVMFFLSPLSVVLMGALAAAVVWRLLVEEHVLWEMPGYAAYASGKHRLIPGVW